MWYVMDMYGMYRNVEDCVDMYGDCMDMVRQLLRSVLEWCGNDMGH